MSHKLTQIKPRIILGIDPGLADVGYGIIEARGQTIRTIDWGNVKTPKTDTLPSRLASLHTQLTLLIKKFSPHLIAVEELFFYKNEKTAITVSHARGVILLTASLARVPLAEFTPLEVKQTTTGYGRADKKQMQKMLMLSLNLKEPPTPDDAADALAIALTAHFRHDTPPYSNR